MRPSDALIHKRLLLDTSRKRAQGQPDWTQSDIVGMLFNAETYYVSPEMTAVGTRAGQQIPRHILRSDDIPSNAGFLIWDGRPPTTFDFPDEQVVVRGACWDVSEFEENVLTPDDTDGHVEKGTAAKIYWLIQISEVSHLVPAPVHIHWALGREPVWTTAENDPEIPTSGDNLADFLLATWVLMGQTIARIAKVPAERHERKRARLAGLPDVITIVQLRRFSEHQEHDEENGIVPWSHRWLVGGHWRNQYHPSTGDHELQWISPYVKGPKHLPLIVKDKIKALVR